MVAAEDVPDPRHAVDGHDGQDDQIPSSSSDLPPENENANGVASTSGGVRVPDVMRHLDPIGTRIQGAATSVKMTFNEKIAPQTEKALKDTQDGWRTKVAPSIESTTSSVASWFQTIGDKVRNTNEKLRGNETYRTMGDGVSYASKTTLDTLREGTKELRLGVADLMTGDPSPAPGIPAMANFFDIKGREETEEPGSNGASNESKHQCNESEQPSNTSGQEESDGRRGGDVERTKNDSRATSQKRVENPNAVLGIRIEIMAEWDAHTAPVPYVVLATTQWLSASEAFFKTPDAFAGMNEQESSEAESYEKVSALLEKFRQNPCYLIPLDTDPKVVISVLWRYLETLPEPLVSFSLYAALARGGGENTNSKDYKSEKEKSDAVETLVGLLPPVRRTALECLLRLSACVVSHSETTKMDVKQVSTVVASKIAWPRAGQWRLKTIAEASLDDQRDADAKQTRELRAVADAARRLITRRGEGIG